MKKKFIYYLTVLILISVISQHSFAQMTFGTNSLFNDDWLFILQEDSTAKNIDYDDSQWRKVDLPHDWSIEGQLSPTLASCTGFRSEERRVGKECRL